ncbi:hypothetical protein PIB30_047706 [Stylosanthes scabra]|uniref:Uncharacterized protein n=1 Tax=Stylosanthes scabra TaxID=79078 RepID=A0ABU6SGP8_9FABA|nr:hypothetical protein [Stylosanthes scabra]
MQLQVLSWGVKLYAWMGWHLMIPGRRIRRTNSARPLCVAYTLPEPPAMSWAAEALVLVIPQMSSSLAEGDGAGVIDGHRRRSRKREGEKAVAVAAEGGAAVVVTIELRDDVFEVDKAIATLLPLVLFAPLLTAL